MLVVECAHVRGIALWRMNCRVADAVNSNSLEGGKEGAELRNLAAGGARDHVALALRELLQTHLHMLLPYTYIYITLHPHAYGRHTTPTLLHIHTPYNTCNHNHLEARL